MKAQTFSPLPLFFARALSRFFLFLSLSVLSLTNSSKSRSPGCKHGSAAYLPRSAHILFIARSLALFLARSFACARSLSLSLFAPRMSLSHWLPDDRRDSRRWCSVLTVARRAWMVGGSARTVATLLVLRLRLCPNRKKPRRRTPACLRCYKPMLGFVGLLMQPAVAYCPLE